MMAVLAVAVGGAIGAPLRYLIDRAVQSRHESLFPWGTLTVNVAGCLLLGVLAGLSLGSTAMHLLGTGFCGALTTYSTFGYETIRLIERGKPVLAALNVAASVVCGLAAVYAGLLLA